METVNIITLIGLGVTFAIAVGGWIYARKNLKTSKYIETITSERIKWLSIIRNEVAELVTNIEFSMKAYLNDIYMATLERQDFNMSPEEELEHRLAYFNSDISVGVGENNIKWSAPNYVTKLRLLQLRLNPKEDTKIINSLNFFIQLYSGTGVSREKGEEAQKHINIIIVETQTMLKNEWEKVKQESCGKRK